MLRRRNFSERPSLRYSSTSVGKAAGVLSKRDGNVLHLLQHIPAFPRGSCSAWHRVSDLFSLCKLFLKGRNGTQCKTLPFNTLLQNLLSLQDGADLKRCQQYQEGKQGRLRLSASGYRQGRGTWRPVQLNALLVSKAEMGTEQYHVFVMTENFLSVS